MHTRVGGWELVRDQSVNQALKQWLWEGGVSQWFLLSSFLSCTPTIIPVFSYQSPFLSLSFLLPFFLFFLTSSQSFLYICFLEFPFPHHSCTSDPCFRPLTTFHLTVRGKQTSRDKFMASQKAPFFWGGTCPNMAGWLLPLDIRFLSPPGQSWRRANLLTTPRLPHRARALGARLRHWCSQESELRDGGLVIHRGTDSMCKYIKVTRSQVSCCQRRELQIWEGKINPEVSDWKWR